MRWLLALGALCIAGCGHAARREIGGACITAPAAGGVWVTIDGEGYTACDQWDRARAKRGEYWRPFSPTSADDSPLCTMAKGTAAISVEEVSSGEGGNGICAELVAAGWSEVRPEPPPSPGDSCVRERDCP